MKFKCTVCHLEFEAEGTRKEYHDPIYGPCATMIAICPVCGEECTELRAPKPQKAGKPDALTPINPLTDLLYGRREDYFFDGWSGKDSTS